MVTSFKLRRTNTSPTLDMIPEFPLKSFISDSFGSFKLKKVNK